MKIILRLFSTLFLINIGTFSFAQDFSVFYENDDREATKHTKYGYDLTSSSISKAEQTFSAIDQSNTIDINFEFFYEKAQEKNTTLIIKVGNKKTIEFTVDLANSSSISINGQAKKEAYFVDLATYREPYHSKSVVLRIAKDHLRSINMGELGNTFTSERYSIDSRNFSVRAISKGKTFVKLGMNTSYIKKLSSFAQNGLKVRAEPNLKSKQIGSIPFGEQVYILDDVDDKNIDLYGIPINTKGNLKVGKLSSRMIKVMYGNKIGYAYGGFLFPMTRKDANYDEKYDMSFNGWMMMQIGADKIFRNKKFTYWHGIIDFENDFWKGLDETQRDFLALTLFSDALTENNLTNFQKQNKTQSVEKVINGFDVRCEVTINRGKTTKIHYKMAKTGFLKSLESHSNGYITASNLNMRASSNTQSKVITKIPFGKKISIIDQSSSDFKVIGGVRGKMIKVAYNGNTGFVFDAYVSPVQPIKLTNQKETPSTNFGRAVLGKEWEVLDLNNSSIKCTVPSYNSGWLIVPSRDKFQAIKNLSTICPIINDLSFKWNKNQETYQVTSSNSKIEMTILPDSWCIVIPNPKSDYERTIIMVRTLGKNFHKISVATEFMGD